MSFHLARNTTHFVGQYSWALAVTLLPFATVFALEFTTPAWVALLAALVLGERMTKSRLGSVVLGFLGVLVIVRPGLASFQPLALLVLFAAFAFAISLIATKQLTNRVSTFEHHLLDEPDATADGAGLPGLSGGDRRSLAVRLPARNRPADPDAGARRRSASPRTIA